MRLSGGVRKVGTRFASVFNFGVDNSIAVKETAKYHCEGAELLGFARRVLLRSPRSMQ